MVKKPVVLIGFRSVLVIPERTMILCVCQSVSRAVGHVGAVIQNLIIRLFNRRFGT